MKYHVLNDYEAYSHVCKGREGEIEEGKRPRWRSIEVSRGNVILFFVAWILILGALNIQAVFWYYGCGRQGAGSDVELSELALRGLGLGGVGLNQIPGREQTVQYSVVQGGVRSLRSE